MVSFNDVSQTFFLFFFFFATIKLLFSLKWSIKKKNQPKQNKIILEDLDPAFDSEGGLTSTLNDKSN